MKQLQINYTTPEQSKKLLELGIPNDSADCYYTQEEIEGNMYWFDIHIKRECQPHTSLHASIIWGEILPCWSVGRLMEIMQICCDRVYVILPNDNILNIVIDDIVALKEVLDFSKLDDYVNK